MRERQHYYVYILSSKTGILYVGITSSIVRRVFQHRSAEGSAFTTKYRVTRLVYYEETGDVRVAIEREKEIKKWRREKKIKLIESVNPRWDDLSQQWSGNEQPDE